MKTTTLANDIYIQGYGTLPKGSKLNVSRKRQHQGRYNNRPFYFAMRMILSTVKYSSHTGVLIFL